MRAYQNVVNDLDMWSIFDIAFGRFWRQYTKENILRDGPEAYGNPPSSPKEMFKMHFEGVMGEFADAKFFNLYYDGNGPNPDRTDVGEAQIRSTGNENNGLFYKGLLGTKKDLKDKPDRIYILNIVDKNEHCSYLIGYAFGYELLKEENWGDHFGKNRPCYRLTQEKLHPIENLTVVDGVIVEKTPISTPKQTSLWEEPEY